MSIQQSVWLYKRNRGQGVVVNCCKKIRYILNVSGTLRRLAHNRGDYDEAARQYQRSLDINERLGNQAGMADTYSQLGILEAGQPDGSVATAVGSEHA